MYENQVIAVQNVGTAQWPGFYEYPGYMYPGVSAAQWGWWGPGSFLFPFLLGAFLF